jgi:PAS domain-containing protein
MEGYLCGMANLAAAVDDRLRALETELEQLAADRQRHVDLFTFAPEPQLVTDAAGNVLDANLAALELLRGEGELRGRRLDWLVPMEQRRGFQSRVSAAIDGSGHARFAGSLRLRDRDVPAAFSVRVARGDGASLRLVWLVMPCHDRAPCESI